MKEGDSACKSDDPKTDIKGIIIDRLIDLLRLVLCSKAENCRSTTAEGIIIGGLVEGARVHLTETSPLFKCNNTYVMWSTKSQPQESEICVD
jgi:hypothetical protein